VTAAQTLIAAAAGAFRTGFGAVLEIAPDGASPFYVDGRGESCAVLAGPPSNVQAACVWRAAPDTLARIFEGGRALESAYLSGRLKISGDMSVMARLVLESSR
jgi:putative sterol carrier protein